MGDFQSRLKILFRNIEKVIVGKREAIELAIITLLCRGHLLIEDVPGLGKTMLARSIAHSLALDYGRIQFTPDLLPSDITGVSIYNQKTADFEFRPGPVFTHILLADEINRTTPRTQASLLECMEESQVTVDGTTHPLKSVFMVIATQNPIELQGTHPLPEAQLDRFFMRIGMGYPSIDNEITLIEAQIKTHPINSLSPVISQDEIKAMQEEVRKVYIEKSVMRYIVHIIDATRNHKELSLGASPRGSIGLVHAVQAMALVNGVDYVEPSMVKRMVKPLLSHRMIVKPKARLGGVRSEKILDEILTRIEAPVTE